MNHTIIGYDHYSQSIFVGSVMEARNGRRIRATGRSGRSIIVKPEGHDVELKVTPKDYVVIGNPSGILNDVSEEVGK